LIDDEHNPTLAELEDAFNIETVTKDFFLKYRELFLRTKEALDKVVENDPKVKADFDAQGVDTVNFAKKLLGQIVFLYFLQKKGWFGVGRDDDWGTGSKQFLRELFSGAHGGYQNFFNDILEPLFYEALRIGEKRKQDDYYYSPFNCKIPFLNGGLFDPIGNYDWEHTDINLPNDLFSNTGQTKEGYTGDGILDVFDRYNFTVREDEPLEKEVAIDPELLGKAYEKFNAIRPDNFEEFIKALKSGKKGEKNKFNKKFGVYYTPREIVHYMCQQSLINYLATRAEEARLETPISKQDIEDLIEVGEMIIEHEATALIKEQNIRNGIQKSTDYRRLLSDGIHQNAKIIDEWLADITVCDPAVGSGAFPVGMMTEIVRTRNVLSRLPQDEKHSLPVRCRQTGIYKFKRRCIEHSLYGVDIDPGAVEIAKLRLWLSLVVDEEDIKNIKPLPNLDYRIMQGNSLISEFMGINFDADENRNRKERISPLEAEEKEISIKIKEQEKQQVQFYNKHHKQDADLSKALTELNRKQDTIRNKINKIQKEIEKRAQESTELSELLRNFQQKKNEFLNESNVSRKATLKKQVDNLLIEIFENKLKKEKTDFFNRLENIRNKYSALPNEKQRNEIIKHEEEILYKESGFDLEATENQLKKFSSGRQIKPFFLWDLYFSEVFHLPAPQSNASRQAGNKGGFDVVIANPPYVKEYVNRSTFDGLRKSPYYQGKMDLWYMFACTGIDVLKNGGILTFIAQNNWVTSYGASKMRNKVIKDTQILSLVDFGAFKIFEAGIQTMVMIFQRSTAKSNYSFDYRRLVGNDLNIKDVVALLNKKSNTKTECLTPKIDRTLLIDKPLTFSSSDVQQILEKISKKSNFHLTEKEVANGIHHHHDRVNRKRAEMLGDKFKVGDGIFVLSNDEINRISFTQDELELIKPSYTTRELDRWYTNPINLEWVIYTDSSFKYKKKIEKYPNIKKHLDQFEKVITSDNKPYGLHRSRDERFFKGEKIIAVRKCSRPSFSYVDFNSYVSATFYIIKTNRINQKYLTALLNSRLIEFWLRHKGKMQGTNFQIDKEPLLNLPLIKPEQKEQYKIISLVNKILTITKDEDYLQNHQKQAKVKELEREIDQLVYQLYGLTEEEIKVVEAGGR